MRIFLLTLVISLCANITGAQITQNVRGTVVDNETKFPLIGAKVQIFTEDTTQLFRALVDENGSFRIKNVPIGKHKLVATYMSYETKSVPVTVNSGKESVVNLEMSEEVFETEEVQIVAQRKGEVLNEMATVSARQFSVEETDRYPGSRSDPARMASNFAGVQGADDSRNDIVIRGNSPLGLLYKVEGIDIPNPNHFSTSGSTGGPVSIINNKILGNSDFFMSAFPAEYGNSTSGVFDLKLRNGNQSVHEFTGQFGFLGTEVMAEGPINKDKRSSYIVMGRYSTLSIFQSLGISIGTDAVPIYGDGAFKLNYPLKKGGAISVWGMGGKSQIDIKISDQTELTDEVYGEGDRDQYFGTSMGVVGLSYKKPVSTRTFLSATFAVSGDEQHSRHYLLERSLDTSYIGGQEKITIRTDSIYQLMGYQFYNTKLSGYFSVNHKINKKHILKAGINMDAIYTNNVDSVLNETGDAFKLRHDFAGAYTLIQPFVQYKWKVNPKMDFTAGLHNQYFSLSNSLSVLEPRLGWKYVLKKNQVITAGAGLHSQTQPLYLYSYQQYDGDGNPVRHNKNMDFTKSIHSAIGYERSFKKGLNVKAETYFQYLYNVPVEIESSALSLINMGSGFQRFFPDSLQNTGTGRNYGIELTIQKYFNKSFFFLITGSLYDSKYTGSDGVERNTDYNGSYTVNVLGGKEFNFKGNQSISLGLKCTTAGGKRYGYVDVEASKEAQELVFLSEGYNTRQFKDYFRLDVKVNYKLNTKKITHEIGLDLVNILNTRNLLGLAYAPNLSNPSAEPIAERTQLGFLPIFYYRIDFKLKK